MIKLLQAIKHGYIDGKNGTTKYKHLYVSGIVPVDTEQLEQLENDIAFYETLVNRNKQIDAILYNMLETVQTDQKKIAILSKLNSNDKATKKALSEIDRLHNMIDGMED